MHYKTPRLETERLVLQKGNTDDFLKVYEFNFTKLRGICGEFEYVKSNSELVATFASYSDTNEDVYDWIVYLKDSMLPIANIVADRKDEKLNSLELSFNMHPTYWGNGYIREALIEVMRFLFQHGYDNVICGYDTGNDRSKRVQEKLGFELYKIEKNSWQKNGVPIDTYTLIMNKEKFDKLYKNLI